MKRVLEVLRALYLLGAAILLSAGSSAYAQTPSSSNFQLRESTIGSGGLLDSSSSSYNVTNSIGDLGVGNSASGGFQLESGSQTTDAPTLSFAIGNSSADFGTLSSTVPATATASFSVKNYTSYGYVVQVTGGTPSNGPKVISAMSSTGPSVPGTSQFGINLVANTSPDLFGEDPDNGQFGFGEVSTGYDTPNQYKYVNGDIIALAPKSSGLTTYTISYVMNVEPRTPGGQYNAGQTIIITGSY